MKTAYQFSGGGVSAKGGFKGKCNLNKKVKPMKYKTII